MKRKDYEKPTMQVIQLRHQSNILTTSSYAPNAGLTGMEEEDL